MSMTRSQRSLSLSRNGLRSSQPALLTRTSILPSCSRAACTPAATLSVLVTSISTASALPPSAQIDSAVAFASAARRSATTTASPSAARPRAMASPMPRAAPVMKATRPFLLDSMPRNARYGPERSPLPRGCFGYPFGGMRGRADAGWIAGMDLSFTDEQQFLREAVRGAIDREAPLARVRDWVLGDVVDYAPARDLAVRQGWTGIGIPEEAGGQGGGLLELAILAEELGRGAVPADALYSTLLAALLLARRGGDAVVEKLAAGESRAALVLSGGGRARAP